MNESSDFERQREGALVLLDSDEVEYFQVFTKMDDGPVMLSGCREEYEADYELFIAQLMRILADHSECSLDEVAETSVQRAQQLQDPS